MKIFTCKEMGGVCEAEISGETADEVAKRGFEHVQNAGDAAHKELFAGIQNMSDEDNQKWTEDFKKKFEEKNQ